MSKMKNKGFSLIEVAMVLVIIGFIIGGVLAGRDLIRQAELKSIIQDVQNYKSAVSAFQIKHLGLPGDIDNANDFWNIAACPDSAAPGGCNGDADGRVEATEDLRAWQHLALSNILQGSWTGVGEPSGNTVSVGENVPESEIAGSGFLFYYRGGGAVYDRNGHFFEFGEANGDDIDNPSLPVLDAWGIDDKIDNGLADSGDVVSHDSNCVTGTSLTVGAAYDFSRPEDGQDCVMIFWYE